MPKKKVLIAGESWTVHSIHQKGFDSFTTTEYSEGIAWLREALEAGDWEVTYQPAHVAAVDFPDSAAALEEYDCVILSDVGANTLLLHPDTFTKSQIRPDRLEAIREYVARGGGLVMIGGYMTFQGIDGKAQYHRTAIEECLPVTLLPHDDRAERPAGVTPEVVLSGHPLVAGVEGEWPQLLGYNIVVPKAEADVPVLVGQDPLIASWQYGEGRSVAFTSDCAPHWAPMSFIEWDGYSRLWQAITAWAASTQEARV